MIDILFSHRRQFQSFIDPQENGFIAVDSLRSDKNRNQDNGNDKKQGEAGVVNPDRKPNAEFFVEPLKKRIG